jgi:putative ABC transport system substrate-binding protein
MDRLKGGKGSVNGRGQQWERKVRQVEGKKKSEVTGVKKMNSKKVFRVAICAMLLALCSPATAQQPAKVPRIGFVSPTGDSSVPGPDVEAFRQGLRDLGYIEGKNILVEYRFIEGKTDRTPNLVRELIQLNVNVLVVLSSPSIRAAKQATKTIPVVMVTTQDPVARGFIDRKYYGSHDTTEGTEWKAA